MTRRQTHGTLLQLGDGAASNEQFTTIAHVIEATPPGVERGVTELADHDMVSTKMYLPNGLGSLTGGDFKAYLDPQDATHEELWELAQSAEIRNWKCVLPNSAGTWEFTAFITKYQPDPIAADDGVLTATMAFQAADTPDLA